MRILQGARLLLALILAANGLAMLAAPQFRYHTVPGVTGTGPLNLHFVRDIGCAYLVAAGDFDLRHLLRDLPGVFLIPAFVLWLSWPRRMSSIKENHHAEMARTASARHL